MPIFRYRIRTLMLAVAVAALIFGTIHAFPQGVDLVGLIFGVFVLLLGLTSPLILAIAGLWMIAKGTRQRRARLNAIRDANPDAAGTAPLKH